MSVSSQRRWIVVALCLTTLGSLICLYYLGFNEATTFPTIHVGNNSIYLPAEEVEPQACVGPPGLDIAADVSEVVEVGGVDACLPLECTKLMFSRARVSNTSVGIF